MQTDSAPENGGWGHPWRWFLARGLAFFAIGVGLGCLGGWVGALWLAWIGFSLAIMGMWMLAIASGESRRGHLAAWWRWYNAAYERNVRAAERHTTNEPSAPQRPNDR